ncbi:phage portal protein [Lachnospiraceae bacterium 54-11]
MWLFNKRADSGETASSETKKTEDDILQAFYDDDNIDFDKAMKVPAFSSCVNMIAGTISMIPIKLYKRNGDAVEEIKDDKRVRLLNDDPGDTLNAVQMKKALVKDYFGKGGYVYINRNGLDIASLHYVDSREIAFEYSMDPIFKEYRILVRGDKYNPYDFIKVLRGTKNGYESADFVNETKEILGVAYSSLIFEKNLVKTGGNKKGFVKCVKKLSDEALKSLKAAWRMLYRNNSENVVVLNDGLEFQESSSTSVELQLNENKKSNSDEICKIFNIPPEMVRGGAKESDKINYIQYCIIPILREIECSLNRDLLLEKEKESCFFAADTTELTKGDIKTRYEAYAIASKNGFMQLDEIRFKENMPALGLSFIKFGLQDVMYNPVTKEFYVPNMNSKGSMGKEVKPDEDRTAE